MEYQRIKYFLKAAETLNFSQAAKELYVSPQALSRQIALLEEELGVKLFDRSTRTIVLNEVGTLAQARFSQIDQDLEAAVEAVKEAGEVKQGKIRVGIFSALPKDAFITPVLTLMLANIPSGHLELKMMELFDVQKEMLDGKLDLAFTNAHEQEEWGDCCKLVFHTVPAQVVVSLYHPWAIKDAITAEDMKQELFLKMESNNLYRKEVGEDAFYEHIPCRKRSIVPNFQTLMTRLNQGEGFAVFPNAFQDSESEKFKFFPVPGRDFRFQTACFYRISSNKNVEEIVRLLREEFNTTENAFHPEQ